MRQRVDPVRLIRDHNPVPDAHQLPDVSEASFEALFEEIIGMENKANARSTGTRHRRLGRAAALAAALLVVTAGVAVAAGVFSPDPADVATIEEDGERGAAAHLEGWRPGLKSESVWCMYDLNTGAATQVSEFPLGEPLTTERLLEECGTGNDVGRNQDATPTDYTVCRGTFTDEEYQERTTTDPDFNVLAGDLSAPRPGFPVVLAWDTDCASTHLDTSFQVDLVPLETLDDTNQTREVEVELKAAALQDCLTHDEATTMVGDAQQRLGEEWLITEWSQELDAECWQGYIDLEWGTITVLGRDEPTPN